MQPDISELMTAWYVWATIFIFTTLMTFIGTYLITRRWPE
jgi:hypothetical protein